LVGEVNECLSKLSIDVATAGKHGSGRQLTTALRKELRYRGYIEWTEMTQKGQGVIQYQQVPAANKWISKKTGMTTAQWLSGLKMTANVVAVRTLPGRELKPQGQNCNTHCRRCGDEPEFLSHVLGHCRLNMNLVTARHNRVRTMIANGFRSKGFTVHEEVTCYDTDLQLRRCDILVIDDKKKTGLLIDPTIRFEHSDGDQFADVDREKKDIYEPCVSYLVDEYALTSISVHGLYFGARGTIVRPVADFFRKHQLPTSLLTDIVLSIINDSAHIISCHLRS
jgi:hypothetical protein